MHDYLSASASSVWEEVERKPHLSKQAVFWSSNISLVWEIKQPLYRQLLHSYCSRLSSRTANTFSNTKLVTNNLQPFLKTWSHLAPPSLEFSM